MEGSMFSLIDKIFVCISIILVNLSPVVTCYHRCKKIGEQGKLPTPPDKYTYY